MIARVVFSESRAWHLVKLAPEGWSLDDDERAAVMEAVKLYLAGVTPEALRRRHGKKEQ